MKSGIKTAVCTVVAIYIYIQQVPVNRDFLCFRLYFKTDFFNRTTTRGKHFYCEFFPDPYQQHCGKTIKKVTYRLIKTVKLKII